ncbi:hypothetical protein V5799_010915 [Amblyomma americanum]|uniref:Uncharacterized protein n=1 Tax=Amblyomma americanum TaxID=6943 RepID=A0AAQ4EIR1_AMBAM
MRHNFITNRCFIGNAFNSTSYIISARQALPRGPFQFGVRSEPQPSQLNKIRTAQERMTEETAMKKFVAIAALLVVSLAGVANAIDCEDPQPFKGDWVTNAENQKQCVALVKEKCTGLRELSTDRWRRGKQVRTNCDSIPRWTAIGTFLDGDKFKGHSAIFESCAPDGIWVSGTLAALWRRLQEGQGQKADDSKAGPWLSENVTVTWYNSAYPDSVIFEV